MTGSLECIVCHSNDVIGKDRFGAVYCFKHGKELDEPLFQITKRGKGN